jgi:hypothetical protein
MDGNHSAGPRLEQMHTEQGHPANLGMIETCGGTALQEIREATDRLPAAI